MAPASRLLATGLAVALYGIGAQADGTGLIGWGKTLYDPTCSFACRNVVRKQSLACTPVDSTANHGTAHNPVSTPPGCFVKDRVFLLTMALCIDTYCPLSENPPMAKLEDYWASHLGTGTLGNYKYVPVMTYHEALAAAREEEAMAAQHTNTTSSSGSGSGSGQEHSTHGRGLPAARLTARHDHGTAMDSGGMAVFNVSSPLPKAAGGSKPLNTTSFVGPTEWQLQWNYMHDFEVNEAGHSTVTIVIAIVAVFLPVALSLLRFVPGFTTTYAWTYWQTLLIHPAVFGRRHREPVAGVGNVPTRGQALYILVISFLNIILWLGPYTVHQPQASFTSLKMQSISIIGNRAGVMAMGNTVALFLFAARNSVLLHVTDWSYSTYLLLHRWLAYWAVFHTVVHSFMLLANYILKGSYEAELAREYWVWGIVGTVAVSAIPLFSLLWVRRRFYEFFLASHIVLSLLFIVGYYYHIWYVYGYNWGYEIWIFVAGGIWGADRLFRLVRTFWQGLQWATITAVDDVDGEYIRIEVDGKRLDSGVVYLGFPTLTWRFWETHPFSVAYAEPAAAAAVGGISTRPGAHQPGEEALSSTNPDKTTTSTTNNTTPSAAEADPEKSTSVFQRSGGSSSSSSSSAAPRDSDATVFYSRTRGGITGVLAAKASPSARVRVLLEGPYHHSGHVSPQLAHCTDMLCIAGGVGITACLPFVRHGPPAAAAAGGGSTKLFWSSRHQGLVTALAPAIDGLPGSVQVETVVGERLKLEAIITREMVAGPGPLAIVVCGPPGMADEVRSKVVEAARADVRSRPYVLVDEAFSW
ncbi:Ferric-chelate reductase [Colletotrichum higginsianum IMI 349063]|uniref:Ferric-chelate reductase n=2 Tax=Colletotrichum higginsianum TaxID=80884 RepID=A0A1B7YF99_COLHI|nr:Ferric-chelate reductase [Colletotrichum higginsianum IMI 349063]OBR10851.1 Ferric-chelate reductase [Colletotrichum higginsianum IMI 349063]TID07188.1 Ferric/cupric reductase transmembrane component 1 [Colletotrichum higginsianum]